MIHTNRCKHCKKPIEDHWYGFCNRDSLIEQWEDSGLAALDAHKEELFERALIAVKLWRDDNEKTMMNIDGAMFNLESILNQIEKEK